MSRSADAALVPGRAVVYIDGLTGNVVCERRTQEHYRIRNIDRVVDSIQDGTAFDRRHDTRIDFLHLLQQLRPGWSGADGIHIDVVRSKLGRRDARDSNDRGLRGCVAGVGGSSKALSGNRRHIDDLTLAAFLHMSRYDLETKEQTARVDGLDPIPLLLGDLEDADLFRDSGVIDQNIDRAGQSDGAIDHDLD